MKRIQSHKGVVGTIVVNAEGAQYFYADYSSTTLSRRV